MLTGYLSALGCRAGDTVDVMVSSTNPEVTIDLVRLLHGDTNPLGPGFVHEEIDAVAPVTVAGGEVDTPIGSFAHSETTVALGGPLSISLYAWPTSPALGRAQAVLALPGLGLSLAVDETGCLTLLADGVTTVRLSRPLAERRWYKLTAGISAEESTLQAEFVGERVGSLVIEERVRGPGLDRKGTSSVILAASGFETIGAQLFGKDLYNGKIARPTIEGPSDAIACWALEEQMSGQSVVDLKAGLDLHLVNAPTRAMTGPFWTGLVHSWTQAPSQYDAIHFHDDDLSDAKWPVSTTLTVPDSLASGVYAVRLRGGDETDHVPLAVRPAPAAEPAKIVLVLSTFTYVAYANEHLTESNFELASEIAVKTGEPEALAKQHQEWGKSVYDHHSDGSGVAYSTFLRPIPNMRPSYRFWGFDAPRRFSCDLYIVHFLHKRGIPFDIMTEHDLHLEADTILAPYQTVIAGSHPEYYSNAMLDAYEKHVAAGGGLLYLGGNGFYWVTTLLEGLPEVVEVRKSEGLRHWEAEPGERYHASTGEPGGLWRTRGRSSHKLFGIGMAGCGWDKNAPGYRRTPASYESNAAWVFDGIQEVVVGDFGLIMNGSSGDEVDRIDYRLGTPQGTIVLASSEPHSAWYLPVPEDVPAISNQLNASFNRDIRSDMVLIEKPGGGAVFSVGSIIFAGGLPINGGNNNVARLLENVVRNFTARGDAKSF